MPSTMSILIIGLMTASALVAVITPYFRVDKGYEKEDLQSRVDELQIAKDTIYRTLKELDFDRVAGKLSETDFHDLQIQYRDRAIEILRSIDQLKNRTGEILVTDDELGEALEREILALQNEAQTMPSPPKTLEDAHRDDNEPSVARFCTQCGVSVSSAYNFCSSCGTRLN